MALINTTTKKDFTDKVLNSKKVVLVDFWAEWCPPCRAMAPTLHKLADELDDTIDVVKINIEESPENNQLAADYGIQSIPNMHVFKDGKVVDNIIGMTPESVLRPKLEKLATA